MSQTLVCGMKRSSKQIMKAFNKVTEDAKGNIKRKQQQQIQILEKVHLEQDEFTEYKEIKHALIDFVVEAQSLETSYQAHRKQMIRTVALKLEDELNRINKPQLVCRISEELINILRQVGIKWNPIYLRRCLDDHYKNPINRANALARQRHPGVPQETGKTVKELEAGLNSKKGWGKEFIVRCNLQYDTKLDSEEKSKALVDLAKSFFRLDKGHKSGGSDATMILRIPLIVKVRPIDQNATVELDWHKLTREWEQIVAAKGEVAYTTKST